MRLCHGPASGGEARQVPLSSEYDSAHIKKSRPDSGIGFQVNRFSYSLGRGRRARPRVGPLPSPLLLGCMREGFETVEPFPQGEGFETVQTFPQGEIRNFSSGGNSKHFRRGGGKNVGGGFFFFFFITLQPRVE